MALHGGVSILCYQLLENWALKIVQLQLAERKKPKSPICLTLAIRKGIIELPGAGLEPGHLQCNWPHCNFHNNVTIY